MPVTRDAACRLARPTMLVMLERAQAKALPLLNKGVEVTPTLQACCGACRTCVTTNSLAIVSGAALYLAKFARRYFVKDP